MLQTRYRASRPRTRSLHGGVLREHCAMWSLVTLSSDADDHSVEGLYKGSVATMWMMRTNKTRSGRDKGHAELAIPCLCQCVARRGARGT